MNYLWHIPLPLQVNEAVLRKVIEWCTHHKSDPASTGEEEDSRRRTTDIDEWDQKFMQVDQEMLFEIILVSFFFFFFWTWVCPASFLLTCSNRPPTTWTSELFWMLDARRSPTWSRANPRMRFARPLTSRTTLPLRRRIRFVGRTNGLKSRLFRITFSRELWLTYIAIISRWINPFGLIYPLFTSLMLRCESCCWNRVVA